MNYNFRLFFIPLFLCLIFISCRKKNGCYIERGPTETRYIDLPAFHTIDHSIKASFVLSTGPEQEVKITGNKNILNLIEKESYVENGIWKLGFESCVGEYNPVLIELTLPNYIGFMNNGIGDIGGPSELATGDEFSIEIGGTGNLDLVLSNMKKINIDLSGSGNIKLSGSATHETISITGTGVVDCFNLNADTSDVFIKGNGSSLVTVQNYLDVEIIGNGTVYYKGYPVILQSIQGSGSLIDAN